MILVSNNPILIYRTVTYETLSLVYIQIHSSILSHIDGNKRSIVVTNMTVKGTVFYPTGLHNSPFKAGHPQGFLHFSL